MNDPVLFIVLVTLAGFLLLLIVPVALAYLRVAFWSAAQLLDGVMSATSARVEGVNYGFQRRARRRRLSRWLYAKVGAGRSTSATNGDILHAKNQTPLIR